MSGFNFSSAPKSSGPSGMQWAAIGGLIQQRQQIGLQQQSLDVQNELLKQQTENNAMIQAQLVQQAANERQRQREKLIDLWVEEFKHQGKSPLQAHKLALQEADLLDLMTRSDIAYSNFQANCWQAQEPLRKKWKNKKEWEYFWSFSSLIFAIPTFLFGFIAATGKLWAWIVVVLFALPGGVRYEAHKEKLVNEMYALRSESFDGYSTRHLERSARYAFYQEMSQIEVALSAIPKSKVMSDSDFRKLIKNSLESGRIEFGA